MGYASRFKRALVVDVNTLTLRQRLRLFWALANRPQRFPQPFRGLRGLRWLVTGEMAR